MNKNHMLVPIPDNEIPDAGSMKIIPTDDPLVCISDTLQDIMLFQPMYFRQGIPGAIRRIYVRKTVADMLLTTARWL